jgi:hypothetical protein
MRLLLLLLFWWWWRQGGWAFLDLEKSDAEDEDEEQSSEGFNPGSDAEEEEEESSEDYSDEVRPSDVEGHVVWGLAGVCWQPCIITEQPSWHPSRSYQARFGWRRAY